MENYKGKGNMRECLRHQIKKFFEFYNLSIDDVPSRQKETEKKKQPPTHLTILLSLMMMLVLKLCLTQMEGVISLQTRWPYTLSQPENCLHLFTRTEDHPHFHLHLHGPEDPLHLHPEKEICLKHHLYLH